MYAPVRGRLLWGAWLACVLGVVGLAVAPVLAVGPGEGFGGGGVVQPPPKPPPKPKGKDKGKGGGGQESRIPELSPGSAAAALTLLAGATLILTDGLRRRR